MRNFFFLIVLFYIFPDIAVAQEATSPDCTSIFCQVLAKFPEVNEWLLVTFTFIGLILRAMADFVAFVGKKLENRAASEWGQKLGSWALWAAQVIGWFGGVTPKAVIAKKVASELEKQKPG